ncbi:MAG: helix-turn-helix domain-containing protein [Proteobacteria bacterium]|nr:helix-turn-helix domain-containing protein [Pseudomonadota bacterium]
MFTCKHTDKIRAWPNRASGLSGYKLSQLSGVPESTISRFLRGKIDLTLGTASRLCKVIGLELRGRDDE